MNGVLEFAPYALQGGGVLLFAWLINRVLTVAQELAPKFAEALQATAVAQQAMAEALITIKSSGPRAILG